MAWGPKNEAERLAARYIPKGSSVMRCKVSGSVAYLYAAAGRWLYIGYVGSSSKQAVHYRYGSAALRDAAARAWLAGQAKWAAEAAARKAAAKAEAAKPHGLKVGDVLDGSWGYDQTNYEFWEVVALKGRRMVTIRKLAVESVATAYMQGRCVPIKGSYLDNYQPKNVLVQAGDRVKLYDFCSLSKADEVKVDGVVVGYKAGSWSSYA